MTHLVDNGRSLIHTAGQKVRGGVGAAATGVKDEVGSVAHGIRGGIDELRHGEHPAAHKREHSALMARSIETVAAAAGAAAAFFVSRLVRMVLHRRAR